MAADSVNVPFDACPTEAPMKCSESLSLADCQEG